MTVEANSAPAGSEGDAMHPHIHPDLEDVPFRTPVLDKLDAKSVEHVDRQWRVLSETARRAVLRSVEARAAIVPAVAVPLSETLATEAMGQLAQHDERTAGAHERMGKLRTFLDMPAVPAELLVPDVLNAPDLMSKDEAVATLAQAAQSESDPHQYRRTLNNIRITVGNNPGVTEAERDMILRRTRYARDVKLLGLMAEQSEATPVTAAEETGLVTHRLPSGTTLAVRSDALQRAPELLQPVHWHGRRQLKDRVYRIDVGGQNFIMKERKTTHHESGMEGGHFDGLTSRQEFEVATEMSNKGVSEHGEVSVKWEKPVGYAEFPDGYQFCVFEDEAGMQTDQLNVVRNLAQRIAAAPEKYEGEFRQTQQRARELWEQRPDLKTGGLPDESGLRKKLGRLLGRKTGEQLLADTLSFDEFTRVRAHALLNESVRALSNSVYAADYTSNDSFDFGFRAKNGEGGRVQLEIFGFDYEYFVKNPQSAAAVKRRSDETDRAGWTAMMSVYGPGDERPIVKLASYAEMEKLGMALPPRDIIDEIG